MSTRWPSLLLLLASTPLARAQAPGEAVRPVPPPGVVVPEADRAELSGGVADLGGRIAPLREALKGRPKLLSLIPDVEVFPSAVDSALRHDEFFDLKDVAAARALLKEGLARAEALGRGEAPWDAATGLVPRAYVSKIDGSVQPYGLIVPPSYRPNPGHRFRLDVWCHGRGETLSEVNFLRQRMTTPGEFAPDDAFVLHLYGRYCNANRFAGEVDLFEALDDVRRRYPIDDNRLVIRGFSMGGAACWQFATHHPSLWAAAAPGAGFSEAADFLKIGRNGNPTPPWYETTLWRLYDPVDYAANLFNLPTVAYSGEKDGQKQAADFMARALAREGIEMTHVIGAEAGHKYTPEAKAEINRRIDSIVGKGRDPLPAQVVFTTYTLRYNASAWVRVDGLGRHWERSRVEAVLDGDPRAATIRTENVTALTLEMAPGLCPFDVRKPPMVILDDQEVVAPKPGSDRSWSASFRKVDGKWALAGDVGRGGLAKKHGLQGPIDDAFYEGFLMVRPTGRASHEKVGEWAGAEMARAIEHWRKQFRGEARVKDDRDVSEADVAQYNLILWGDPGSNSVIARVLDRLPVRWSNDRFEIAGESHDARTHAPILIYPNPLNPSRYVVLNSGFTFREFDYLNNARQSPKLPDFAVVDVASPATPKAPGKVVQAGFFDESWQPRAEPRTP